MRRGVVIVGIILLIVGLILVVLPFLQSTSYNIPEYPSSATLTPQIVGSGSIAVSWSGAPANTHVVVYACNGGTCSAQSTPLVNQSGSSGSFSFNVQGGSTYAITESGSAAPIPATITVSGLTYGQLAGIALLVVGVVVAILGVRGRARGEATEEAAAPVERPAPAAPPTPKPAATPVPEVIYGSEPSSATPPAASSSAGRPSRTCANCGTVNEPWITNCRKCKRPLASTGQ